MSRETNYVKIYNLRHLSSILLLPFRWLKKNAKDYTCSKSCREQIKFGSKEKQLWKRSEYLERKQEWRGRGSTTYWRGRRNTKRRFIIKSNHLSSSDLDKRKMSTRTKNIDILTLDIPFFTLLIELLHYRMSISGFSIQ